MSKLCHSGCCVPVLPFLTKLANQKLVPFQKLFQNPSVIQCMFSAIGATYPVDRQGEDVDELSFKSADKTYLENDLRMTFTLPHGVKVPVKTST